MFTDFSSFIAVSPSVIPKPRGRTEFEDAFKLLPAHNPASLTCRTNYYKIQMACFLIQRPQGLFRNYSDAFLPVLKPHMERLADDSHESTQRCVAEIIAGLVRGSKHWSFGKVSPAASLRDATKIREPRRCLTIFTFETPLSHT